MKQILLSLLAACTMAPAFAQTKTWCDLPNAARKGGMLYYGSLGGFTVNNVGSRQSSVFINSGLGYLLTDHLTLGVQGGLSHFRVKAQGPGEASNSGYEAGAFARYTAYLAPKIFIFGQADAGYTNVLNGFNAGGLELNIHPGAGVFIGRNWALNVNADLFSLRTGPNQGTTAFFNFGQGYRFGVSKNFGGRHKVATTN